MLDAIGKAGGFVAEKIGNAGETVANMVKDDIRDIRLASDTVSVASNLAKLVGKEDAYRDNVQKVFNAVGLGDTRPDYNAGVGKRALAMGNSALTVLPIPIAGSGVKMAAKGVAKVGKMIKPTIQVGKSAVATVKSGKDAVKALITPKNWKLTPLRKAPMTTKKGDIIYKPRYMGQQKQPFMKVTDWRQKPYNRAFDKAGSKFDRNLERLNDSMNALHRIRKSDGSIRQGVKDIRKGTTRLAPAGIDRTAEYTAEEHETTQKKKKRGKR